MDRLDRELNSIFPKFGTRLVLIIILIAIISIIGASAISFYFLQGKTLGPDYGGAFKMLVQLKNELLFRSLLIYALSALLIVLGVAVVGLLYSHRIAGPMYRLAVFLDKTRDEGLGNRLRFRRRDATHPLAEAINRVMERYEGDMIALSKELAKVEQTLKSLKTPGASIEDVQDSLRLRIKKIREITNGIRA